MTFELRKIAGNRYAALLLIFVVIVNMVLFFNHCTADLGGFTYAEIAEEYQHLDSLEEDYEQAANVLVGDTDSLDGDALFEAIQHYQVLKETKLRVEEVTSYKEYLDSLLCDALASIRSGRIDSNSFEGKALQQGLDCYSQLNGLQPEISFSGGIEVFHSWYVTDILFLLFGIVASSILLVTEYSTGMKALLYHTARGHCYLYLQKVAAMLVAVLIGFLLLYGANIAISASTLGLGRLSREIQSVYGMRSCPVPLTVLGWLFTFFGGKLLMGIATSSLFFLFCCIWNKPSVIFLASALALGCSLLMANSSVLWLQTLSIWRMAQIEKAYRNCFYLNCFDIPISQRIARVAAGGGIALFSCILGGLAFCRTPVASSVKRQAPIRISMLLPVRHTSLSRHEGYKLFLGNGVLYILAALLVFQVVTVCTTNVYFSEEERYYRSYSEQLSGKPSPEKAAFLADEERHFAALEVQLDAYIKIAQGNEAVLESLARDILMQLRKVPTFERVREQYNRLADGQEYVYETGYLYLFDNSWQDLIFLGMLCFVLVISLSHIFSQEQESGVFILQNTYGAAKAVTKRKILLAALVLILAIIFTFLPPLCAVASSYGLPQLSAQANSVSVFSSFTNSWKIWEVFLLKSLVYLALGAAAVSVILFFSYKTRNTVSTMLICLGILVIPVCGILLIIR